VNPTKRADDTELVVKKIAQVRIFDSASSTPGVPIAAVPGGDVSFRTDVLSPGTHNFTAVVIDTEGQFGAPVKLGSVDVEAAPLLAPPAGVSDPAIEVRDADNRIVVPKVPAKPDTTPAAKPAPAAAAPKAP